ncbi:MAG: YfhO family protein [Oligoflexia bacterium]|nr:YfhO family protein [Oligoflexia bacterium]
MPTLILISQYKNLSTQVVPALRLTQKYNAYPVLPALDLDLDVFSEKINRGLNLFSSYGNLLGLLYPDHSYKIFLYDDFKITSEVFQYIGILGLLVFIYGLISGFRKKNKFIFLSFVMIIIIAINMYNFFPSLLPFGSLSSSNQIQLFFEKIFPFLKKIEIRSVLGASLSIFMAIPLALGIKNIQEQITLLYRSNNFFYYGVSIYILIFWIFKMLLSYFVYNKILFITIEDLLFSFIFPLFSFIIFLSLKYKKIKIPLANFILIFLLLFDCFWYSKNQLLSRSNDSYFIEAASKEWSYHPFVNHRIVAESKKNINLCMSESFSKRKGAFPNIASVFLSKRYYHFFTSINPDKQIYINGILNPILHFYPIEQIIYVKNEHDSLKKIENSSPNDLLSTLIIQKNDTSLAITSTSLPSINDYPISNMRPLYLNDILEKYLKNVLSEKTRYLSYPEINSSFAKIKILEEKTNSLSFNITTTKQGYLYFSDVWDENWHVLVNGKESNIEKANFAFKGVFLESGTNDVFFYYSPTKYLYAVIIYFLTLIIIFISIKRIIR